MQDKKKILIVLQRPLHVRNFITTGLVNDITKYFHIILVIPRKLLFTIDSELAEKVSVEFIEDFQPSPLQKWCLDLFKVASTISRHRLNHTYSFKLRERLWVFNRSWAYHRFSTIKILVKSMPRYIILFFLSFIFDLESLSRRLYEHFKINPKTLELIDKFKIDMVFSSTIIYETSDIEIARAAKLRKITLVNFVASWDNLTSKGFFIVQPDILLVWGQVDKDSAIKEHGFRKDQIRITGAPHFDFYFNGKHDVDRERFLVDRGIDLKKKVILWAGSSYNKLPYEPLIVKKLSEYLLKKKKDDILIWYRAHPRAMRINALKKLSVLKNVYVDEQVLKIHNDPRLKRGFSVYTEDLAHFSNLINACEGGISFFSTMGLELALHKKVTLYINFQFDSKGREYCETRKYKDMRAHFLPMMNWDGVEVANDFNALTDNLDHILKGDFEKYGESLQKNAETIAFNLDAKAQSRIIDALLEK